jgi:hypothetical protein
VLLSTERFNWLEGNPVGRPVAELLPIVQTLIG